jgi:hypothetical protein
MTYILVSFGSTALLRLLQHQCVKALQSGMCVSIAVYVHSNAGSHRVLAQTKYSTTTKWSCTQAQITALLLACLALQTHVSILTLLHE